MDKIIYVCTGTCQAKVSEAEFNNGLTQCGAESCSMHGHKFEKRFECSVCGQLYSESENHTHQA